METQSSGTFLQGTFTHSTFHMMLRDIVSLLVVIPGSHSQVVLNSEGPPSWITNPVDGVFVLTAVCVWECLTGQMEPPLTETKYSLTSPLDRTTVSHDRTPWSRNHQWLTRLTTILGSRLRSVQGFIRDSLHTEHFTLKNLKYRLTVQDSH